MTLDGWGLEGLCDAIALDDNAGADDDHSCDRSRLRCIYVFVGRGSDAVHPPADRCYPRNRSLPQAAWGGA
jgi:hypothetical protein